MAKLGLGIMRFQNAEGIINYEQVGETIDEYMKGDFCYFDLHPGYVLGMAQTILRKYVVGNYPRNSFFVANKMPYYGIRKYEDYQTTFDQELMSCGVDYFDYYLLHAITADVYKMHEEIGGFKFLSTVKSEGKVKKIGFSFHDSPELLEEILEKHPEIDFVQLQINYVDWERPPVWSKKCYEMAVKYGKPVFVMEPLKGGGLLNGSTSKKNITSDIARALFKFVSSLPGVKIVLSGMTDRMQVVENRKSVEEYSNIKSNIDLEKIRETYNKKNSIQCTGCAYCKKECPMGISIPEIISILNACQNVGRDDTTAIGRHTIFYKGYIKPDSYAGKCISCKKCEAHCPQKLEIHKYMRKAKDMFESKKFGYTVERNAQMLIYLLKENNIKKIVVSPGTTNICFSYSVQQDDFFEVYSSADERSAAYIACGMAAESGEPVVLSCTGATASRNYLPGLTEAFYRNLPILAVTSTQPRERAGNNFPQFIDRSVQPKDAVGFSVYVPSIHTQEDSWIANLNINKAILELTHKNSKPVHINLETEYRTDYSVKKLPKTRVIKRYINEKEFPKIEKGKKIGIFIGAHKKMSEKLINSIDAFCEKYDSVVLQDHTGNYTGKYSVLAPLITFQERKDDSYTYFDLLIHIGDISGAYMSIGGKEVWRVDVAGRICDAFRTLSAVFETTEEEFFGRYAGYRKGKTSTDFYNKFRQKYDELYSQIPELPFSNIWAASKLCPSLPQNCVLHLAILHSLRSFNFFEIDKSIITYSNTGGFGIDGCMSSLIGASLVDENRLFFGIIGDLSFFYDINSLGNRHIGRNIRIMLVSNGMGTEFKNYSHIAYRFGDDADKFIAAAGHYGNKSKDLVKNYVTNLGFKYISAKNKDEFNENIKEFTNPAINSSIVFEIFTDHVDESDSLKLIRRIDGEALKNSSYKTFNGKPKHFKEKYKNYVLWGTGNCFQKNISAVEQRTVVKCVCDNDEKKWNNEIVDGLKCISPNELSKMNDVFVIIMLENPDTLMQVANQLIDLGIKHFDSFANWMNYNS